MIRSWKTDGLLLAGALGISLFVGRAALADESPQSGDASSPGVPWSKKLKDWRAELERTGYGKKFTNSKVAPEIAEIDDPAAVEPLLALFRKEKDHNLKRRYVQALGNIAAQNIGDERPLAPDSADAKKLLAALAKISVEENAGQDKDPVRVEALAQLKALPSRRELVSVYARYLAGKYVTRAAEAILATEVVPPLSSYEKPDPVLTPALIKALVGTKKVPVKEEGVWRQVGPYVSRITGEVSRGYWHRTWTRYVDVPDPIETVHEALVKYTSEDHKYDQVAWRDWYERQQPAICYR